jgi:pimeloyl-ACP methyl ester carboxylesterase
LHNRIPTLTRAAAVLVLACVGCRSTAPSTLPLESGRVASFDGLELAYDAAGLEHTDAPALLFVHGWCCNRGHWTRQLQVFRAEHPVVALDLGGHGASGADRAAWRMEDLARDVQAVVEALELDPVVLIGHSMGGPVSLFAAALMPERVVGVIGVETMHDPSFGFTEEGLRPFLDEIETDYAGFLGRHVRETFGKTADPELVERVVREAAATPKPVAIGLLRAFIGFDLARALAACPVPVRAINAAPTRVDLAVEVAPGFEAKQMLDVGHFPMLEDPLELEHLLREAIAKLER